jgi:hypothetical protein
VRSPEFSEADFDGIGGIFFILGEAGLEVGDPKDPLEGRVDPAGPVLVAKTEHACL